MPSHPLNPTLYNSIVREAKRKFLVWPSAYASGWVVKTYKDRGGRWKASADNDRPLERWYREEWVNVCAYVEEGKMRPCGRKNAHGKATYPYCRPRRRVSAKTPTTLSELLRDKGRGKVREMCRRKRSNPRTRIT